MMQLRSGRTLNYNCNRQPSNKGRARKKTQPLKLENFISGNSIGFYILNRNYVHKCTQLIENDRQKANTTFLFYNDLNTQSSFKIIPPQIMKQCKNQQILKILEELRHDMPKKVFEQQSNLIFEIIKQFQNYAIQDYVKNQNIIAEQIYRKLDNDNYHLLTFRSNQFLLRLKNYDEQNTNNLPNSSSKDKLYQLNKQWIAKIVDIISHVLRNQTSKVKESQLKYGMEINNKTQWRSYPIIPI